MSWEELFDRLVHSGWEPDEVAESLCLFDVENFVSVERYGATMWFDKVKALSSDEDALIGLYRIFDDIFILDHYEKAMRLRKELSP